MQPPFGELVWLLYSTNRLRPCPPFFQARFSIRLYELTGEGKVSPARIIGAPVGFVNVVQAKELIMQSPVPCIVARGRKGGSNVAAAIVNALMYMLD